MKRQLIRLLCSLMLIGNFNYLTVHVEGESVPDSAWQLTPLLNVGWNLGNSLEAQNLDYGYLGTGSFGEERFNAIEKRFGNPVTTKEMIDAIAQAGFSSIRIPLSFYNHLLESNPRDGSGVHPGLTVDPEWLDRVKEIVDWSLDAGLYVVINNHHDTSMWMNLSWIYADEETYETQVNNLTNIWSQVATYFKDYDNRLVFQSTGEIVNPERSFHAQDYRDFQIAHDLNQAFIDVVRSTGGNNANRFLILETYAANSGNLFVDQNFYKPYQDSASNKLIFGVHNYSSDIEELQLTFKELYKRAVKYNTPFIMDECGAGADLELNKRIEVSKTLTAEAKKYGMAIMVWDNGSTDFGLIDRNQSGVDGTPAYLTNGQEIVNALLQGKNNTDELSEEEKQTISQEEYKVDKFLGLNKENKDVLHKGQYAQTDPNAFNPVTEYTNAPSYFSAMVPYYKADESEYTCILPDGISVVIKELDENFHYLRSKYNTASGGMYKQSNDAKYICIYFRSNNQSLTIDDYKNYVENGQLQLIKTDYSEYEVELVSAEKYDNQNNVTIKWNKLDFVSGYQVYKKKGTNGSWQPVSDKLSKDTQEFVDTSTYEDDVYYTVKGFVDAPTGTYWTGFNQDGIPVSIIEDDLHKAKETANNELENYKNLDNYTSD